jgi:hypothetical protein
MTLDDVVKAERERLLLLADGKDAYFLNCWLPDSGPDVLIGPDEKPAISMEELLENYGDDYKRLYYRRSGRFLGVYADQQEADAMDPYRFSRALNQAT